MVIKVQVLDVQTSSAATIKYGLVAEGINKKFFNRGRNNEVFNTELLSEVIIPNKTVLKYTMGAVLGSESVTVNSDNDEPVEVTYHYVFLSEHVLGIEQLEDDVSDGDA